MKKEQNELVELLKQSNDLKQNLYKELETEFSLNGISFEKNNPLNLIKDNSFVYDMKINLEEQFNSYVSNYELKTCINDKKELDSYVNQVNKEENLKNLIEKITLIDLLNEYIFSNSSPILDKLNEDIRFLNKNHSLISQIEKIAYEKKVKSSDLGLIQQIIKLQEDIGIEKCIICGSINIKKGVEEWKKIIEDKNIEFKQDIKKKLENYNKLCNDIIKNKDLYISLAPITINNIEKFNFAIEKAINTIDSDSINLIELEPPKKENLTSDINKKIQEIANYLVMNKKNKLIFINSVIPYLSDLIQKKKLEIDNKLQENANQHTDSINDILIKLGLEKEIKVKVDRSGGQIKYTLQVDKQDISILSDGQKHKLALAVFLNSIKSLDLSNKIIVFDDPMVAMDEYTYHLFKNYLINYVMTKDNNCPSLIITTHNFNYLYIQLSNIITNEDLRANSKVLKLYPDKIKEFDIELFRLDDLALFKKAISNIECNQQLLNISCLYNKIFREFLDLKLRLVGYPLNGNPTPEIELLPLNNEIKKTLKRNNIMLCNYSKDSNINLEKAKNGLSVLIESIKLLGFGEYFNDLNIDKIINMDKSDEKYIRTDIDIIIEELSEILKNNEIDIKYKNYINHPRISFTKNALATSLDI